MVANRKAMEWRMWKDVTVGFTVLRSTWDKAEGISGN